MVEACEIQSLHCTVNGEAKVCDIAVWTTLLDVLRDHFFLTGTKKGCDRGQCGACTVLIDGERHYSCLRLAVTVEGSAITTIEGLAEAGGLHPVQQAFAECDALQCGFCTPGQIMAAVALLKEGHVIDEDNVAAWMAGNLCRCAAYPNIVAAIISASKAKGAE